MGLLGAWKANVVIESKARNVFGPFCCTTLQTYLAPGRDIFQHGCFNGGSTQPPKRMPSTRRQPLYKYKYIYIYMYIYICIYTRLWRILREELATVPMKVADSLQEIESVFRECSDSRGTFGFLLGTLRDLYQREALGFWDRLQVVPVTWEPD